MCRCGQCKNKWQTVGVAGQVSFGNKVRDFHCSASSDCRRIGVACTSVESSSVGDTY
jgi:hypothetical protein